MDFPDPIPGEEAMSENPRKDSLGEEEPVPILKPRHQFGPSHQRNVSWSLQQPDLLEESASPMQVGRFDQTSQHSIQLEQVTQHQPLEPESETVLMRSLDSQQQDLPSDSVLPDGALEALTMDEDSAGVGSAASSFLPIPRRGRLGSRGTSVGSTKPVHRRTQTMEEKLFGLTAALDAYQAFEPTTPVPPPVVDISSGDALGIHADMLYNRRRPPATNATPMVDMTPSSDDAPPQQGLQHEESLRNVTAERWKKVRASLYQDHPLHKKNDDHFIEAVVEADEEELLELESGDTPPKASPALRKIRKEWKLYREFQGFFAPRRSELVFYLKVLFLYLLLPLLGAAVILFHWAGNPPTGILGNGGVPVNGTLVDRDGNPVEESGPSASWWCLFVARQLLTGSIAKFLETVVIDFLSIRTRVTLRLFGPWPTLLILQSRGWPFILFFWALLDFGLLSGEKPFVSHWGFWQSFFDLFNRSNPSGHIVDSQWNQRILAVAVSLGAVAACKRFWLGLYLGRQTFAQYADKLRRVMNKILWITKVASLARDIEKYVQVRGSAAKPMETAPSPELRNDAYAEWIASCNDDGNMSVSTDMFSQHREGEGFEHANVPIIDADDRHPLTGALSEEQRARITRALGVWEEPIVQDAAVSGIVSVAALLQFRRAMAWLATPYPFSGHFGLANTRESCIESCQDVYERLMMRNPNDNVLSFEVVAILALDKKGEIDTTAIKELIRLFRPQRNGTLTMLDFVKSVDSVYKELKLLRASVANSSKIDRAFETMFNVVFYAVVLTIILSQLGFDPLALFISVSGVILAFAFMIGSAASKYFEGILFILGRRPYQIGDGIHVSNVEQDTAPTGSAWWTVEDVTLFYTRYFHGAPLLDTLVVPHFLYHSVNYMFTGERATLSNGSLANSRVINSSRSPQAYLYTMIQFPVSVTVEKLTHFRNALEQFFKNRPREWLSMVAFRATQVVADRGFIEYIVVGQHRSNWADWTAIMLSKAEMMHFCLELSKKLDIRYVQPPMPIEMSMKSPLPDPMPAFPPASPSGSSGIGQPDLSTLMAQFLPRKLSDVGSSGPNM